MMMDRQLRRWLVPVGSLVVGRVPCDDCDGTGRGCACWLREAAKEHTTHFNCPSCGGSGMTWPDWVLQAGSETLSDATGWEIVRLLDALRAAQPGDKP